MTPADILQDHALRPRHVGKLLNASAVGDVGSIVVGDALRLAVSIADRTISGARFQVFNAADQVAPASLLCGLVAGRAVEAARRLGPVDMAGAIPGLDPLLLPPLPWALIGLRAALALHAGEDLDADQDLDPLICRCFGVPEETVRQAITIAGHRQLDEIGAATGAGTACGTCRVDIARLLTEVTAPGPAAAPASAPSAAQRGRIPTLLRIRQTVEREVAPAARARGEDIELWDFSAETVTVRIRAPSAERAEATRSAVEAVLRAQVDARLVVAMAEVQPGG